MKIIKLFIDENIKTWKKLSTKIMIIAIILSLFAVLGIVKIMEKTESYVSTSSNIYENQDEYLKQQIEYYETQLQNEKLDEETRLSMERALEESKLFLEYKVSPYDNSWENELITYIVEQKENGQKGATSTDYSQGVIYGFTFSASSSNAIYGKVSTVQPSALRVLPCIKI